MSLWDWYGLGLCLQVFTSIPAQVLDDTDELSPVLGFCGSTVWISAVAMVWPALFLLAAAQLIIDYQERT